MNLNDSPILRDLRDVSEVTGASPKPQRADRLKAARREERIAQKGRKSIRAYVFHREADICRCCRLRRAESMHEIQSRGAGGKVSKRNSIAVCGTLVGTEPSCHTYLQRCEIRCHVHHEGYGAEGDLFFQPHMKIAADWLRTERMHGVESGPTPRIRGEVMDLAGGEVMA